MSATPDMLTDTEIAWLLDQGVSPIAMLDPTPIRAASVVFLDGNTFDFDSGGIRALIFTEPESDDLVGWNPRQKTLATWCSRAVALGQDAIFNPATYFMGGKLHVHADPLAWLKADREGIVIVKPELTYAYLRDRPLKFADRAHAEEVKRWREPPRPSGELFVEVSDERAAA